MEITISLASELIAKQFPQWAHLPINPVKNGGHDNRTFRLGNDMLIRLPSAEQYALQVQKEQKWLPILAPHISFAIPEPIALGKPSELYPFHWSIYRWIEGKSVNNFSNDELDLPRFAVQLAQFLNELHRIDTTSGPVPGPHNFYRGDHVAVYDTQTRAAIEVLKDIIDVDSATSVWERAISSKWDKKPVWVHGDISTGNLLVNDGRLCAVIDFGLLAVGDPACDLAIAWTFLADESRKIFKECLELDAETWARAHGWALWKALIMLAELQDKTGPEAMKQQQIIHEIIDEHKFESRKYKRK